MLVCACVAAEQVNVPKQRRTFCKSCKRHSSFKVTQYKAGKPTLTALGEWGGAGERLMGTVPTTQTYVQTRPSRSVRVRLARLLACGVCVCGEGGEGGNNDVAEACSCIC